MLCTGARWGDKIIKLYDIIAFVRSDWRFYLPLNMDHKQIKITFKGWLKSWSVYIKVYFVTVACKGKTKPVFIGMVKL